MLNRAAVFLERGDLDAAIMECKDAIDKGREVHASFATIAKAYARIGQAHVKKGDLDDAIEAFEASLTESISEDVQAKLKKAKEDLKKQQELAYEDPEKGREANEQGGEAFKKGEFPEAVKFYTEAIKRDPKMAKYYRCGCCFGA
jgi:stress-induced-phosphoprotein 1